jgi:murein DD-endopeptidase MepM/ murein hydrolase activator NlpD
VDLLGAAGQAVLAAGSGTVSFAGPVAGRSVVVVAHPGGLRTTYEPVDPGVTAGQAVRRGEVIGTLSAAASHCSPRRCLHWGLLRAGSYLDPLTLLAVTRAVLLPVGPP